MYRDRHLLSLTATPIAEPAKLPASKRLPLSQMFAGIYASVWGSIVAFAGIVLLKTGIASGLPFGGGVAVILIAIFVLPGLLMLISGIWLIWRARWARWVGLVSTIGAILVALGLGNLVGTVISLGLIVVLLLSLPYSLNRPAVV